jgi:hypothetical protein
VDVLVAHFVDADLRGKAGTASRESSGSSRSSSIPRHVRSCSSRRRFERWDGHGALGYLVLDEIVRATLEDPPSERA